jgi:hypothetical protein
MLVGIVGLLAGVAGCDAERPDAAGPAAPVVAPDAGAPSSTAARDEEAIQIPGLTATLEQYREDEIQGLMSVQTSNRSSSTVQFRDLRLRWPGLATTEPYVRSTQLSPGVTFDVRVRQGAAVCGDPPRVDGVPPADAAIAVGIASVDGAPPVAVAIPIDDERAILPKVYRRSCQEQRLTWAAELRFGDHWAPATTASGKPAVLGTLELRRHRSDEPLTITRINGSVLLRISAVAASDPVVTLDPGQDAASIPITIAQSGNCDAHALIESKKTFIIPIGLAIGEADPMAYVIRFDTPTKQLLNRMINESCGVG